MSFVFFRKNNTLFPRACIVFESSFCFFIDLLQVGKDILFISLREFTFCFQGLVYSTETQNSLVLPSFISFICNQLRKLYLLAWIAMLSKMHCSFLRSHNIHRKKHTPNIAIIAMYSFLRSLLAFPLHVFCPPFVVSSPSFFHSDSSLFSILSFF